MFRGILSYSECESVILNILQESKCFARWAGHGVDLNNIISCLQGKLCRICTIQVQPRKHVLDHVDFGALTRQHEIDHTDQQHFYVLKYVGYVGIDYRSEMSCT